MSFMLVIPVRQHSTRIENKLLRPFGDSCLFEVCLRKLLALRECVLVAAGEKPFFDLCGQYGFKWISRSLESLACTDGSVAHPEYLRKISANRILMLNACTPLLKPQTIVAATQQTAAGADLVGVRACRKGVWDSYGNPVNRDLDKYDTAEREPLYVSTDAFVSFDRQCYLETGRYWERQPAMFEIDAGEAFDVDTKMDFDIAEFLWWRARG